MYSKTKKNYSCENPLPERPIKSHKYRHYKYPNSGYEVTNRKLKSIAAEIE